ncbi:hypothetical protein N3C_1909 [Clostridium sp. N3C]|nr:hypothetical protein N3C_1909 [Clostridium sp. N3C]
MPLKLFLILFHMETNIMIYKSYVRQELQMKKSAIII